MRIYNTRTRQTEGFSPAEPNHVRMYVCGMTVYDYCHIGHARAMLTFDMVYRWLRERGWQVTYVRNYTDVDDKIIQRAAELGEAPLTLSERFIAALTEDMDRLGLALPTHQPKVSEHIDGIVAMVGTLIERGHAYAVDGDVFFDVASFPRYGQLSGKKLQDLRSGERVVVDPRKRQPSDFALWKAAKDGEISWPAPTGAGRPGWHIECSVMSTAFLGDTFDIHGGGIDLVFPHHENEIAQTECATGTHPFANVWMHNGHLTMGETKMSKSLGNIIRIRDILDQVPAEALRLLYLESHYRSPLPFSGDRLAEATGAMDRLYQAKAVLEEMAAQAPGPTAEQVAREIGGPAHDLYHRAAGFAARFAAGMDEDFNTSVAIAELYALARAANRFANNKKWRKKGHYIATLTLEAYALSGRVLGLGGMDSADWFQQVRQLRLTAIGKTEADVNALITQRTAARQAKDWARADALRDALTALDVVIMDGASGTNWRMTV